MSSSGPGPPERIPAAEAAARLGVKRATLYAYVSRGLLTSRKDDGRTSTFDPLEIEQLRRHHRTGHRGGLDLTIPTRLTRLADDRLWFRGHAIEDLVEAEVDYEAVAELLWTGQLAEPEPWARNEPLLDTVLAAQAVLPRAAPVIDRLRLTVTVASAMDPLRHDLHPLSIAAAGRTLTGVMVDGLPLLGSPRSGRIADRLWARLTSKRGPAALRRLLNTALVLLADHELATATVGVRVAASARADPYSVVITGLGAVAGSLHGAASIECYDMLTAAHRAGGPAPVIGELLRQGRKIPGFGHKVYTVDPRAPLLLDRLETFATPPQWQTISDTLAIVGDHTPVNPNIDFALASFALCSGFGREAGEAIFAIARCAGWLAHAMEEYDEAPLRFRPTARYIGTLAPGEPR